jgi:hypothetical protein
MKRSFFTVIIFFLLTASLAAQWKMIAPGLASGKTWYSSSVFSGGSIIFSDGVIWMAYADKIYSSSDTGKTWRKNNLQGLTPFTLAVGLDFLDKNNGVVAFLNWKTFKTRDGGISWEELPFMMRGQGELRFLNSPELLLATNGETIPGNYSAFPFSQDGGLTWQLTLDPSLYNTESFTKYRIGSPLYSLLPNKTGGNAIFASGDMGKSWQKK